MTPRDRLQRRVVPRLVVHLSTVRAPARAAALLRRAAGRADTVRLYVAYDDPYSAVAVLGLTDRLRGRRARLLIEPVVRRGIPGDPAVEAKRRYAVVDARRLAARDDRTLTRSEPLRPEATAFLAGWTAAIGDPVRRAAFSAAAMAQLWCASSGPVDRAPFAALWDEHVGGPPPADDGGTALPAERGMRLRRLYDTPVAVVHGQWFFAHERLPQIEHRLDELAGRAGA